MYRAESKETQQIGVPKAKVAGSLSRFIPSLGKLWFHGWYEWQ